VRDVERLLRIPRRAIHALVKAGFVKPARGPRNAYRFSFQDLIVLRTAQTLAAANLPAKRIARSLRALRRQIPESMPLSGLAISALGDRIVVKEGGHRWHAESGQYLLAFDGDPDAGAMRVIERRAPVHAESADDWFEAGYGLEQEDPEAACEAYARALELDARHAGASANLGRLLHEAGRPADAERVYRDALAAGANDATLWYNLGVLLADMKRPREAVDAYEAALRLDPHMLDAHYNLALVYEALAQHRQALRHMAQYRRLARNPR
ncbi:MAG TPA: tetratricopeptide repeat protein, partial [Burkholderiales bacterium]